LTTQALTQKVEKGLRTRSEELAKACVNACSADETIPFLLFGSSGIREDFCFIDLWRRNPADRRNTIPSYGVWNCSSWVQKNTGRESPWYVSDLVV
jgi:hypothetical protein